MKVPPEQRDALQPALAAEHAAVYAYGVIGGVLQSSQSYASYAAHRGRRDQLMEMIGDGAVAAEPVYELPFEVTGQARAERLAVHVEERCAEAYAEAVSRTLGAVREYAARGLTDCAVRELAWGGEPEPWPGLRDAR